MTAEPKAKPEQGSILDLFDAPMPEPRPRARSSQRWPERAGKRSHAGHPATAGRFSTVAATDPAPWDEYDRRRRNGFL